MLSSVSHLGSLRVMPGDTRLCQFSGHVAKCGWLQLALSSFSVVRCGELLLLCSRASREVRCIHSGVFFLCIELQPYLFYPITLFLQRKQVK